MKISVFDEVIDPIPSNKKNKDYNSKFASDPYLPKILDIPSTFEAIIEVITKNAWSPSIFNGFRKMSNFKQTDLMVLDIDHDMTVYEAADILEKLKLYGLIMATSSHTEDHHKFRVIVPLSRTIFSKLDFDATWEKLAKHFPSVDAICKDCTRFYFGCKPNYIITEGEDFTLLDPEIIDKERYDEYKGFGKIVEIKEYENIDLLKIIYPDREVTEIPESLDVFLTIGPNGGINDKGHRLWWRSLNDFVFTLSLMSIEYETVVNLVATIAPEELTEFDLNTIDRAYVDGERLRD